MKAIVDGNLPVGFRRRLHLPVYGETGLMSLEKLTKQDASWHKAYIHVCFPSKGSKGYIYIGSRGLKGGMQDPDFVEYKQEGDGRCPSLR